MKLIRQLEDNLLPSTIAEIIYAIDGVEKPTREQALAQRELFAMLVNNVGFVLACEYVARAKEA
jgi:hypothetical protein